MKIRLVRCLRLDNKADVEVGSYCKKIFLFTSHLPFSMIVFLLYVNKGIYCRTWPGYMGSSGGNGLIVIPGLIMIILQNRSKQALYTIVQRKCGKQTKKRKKKMYLQTVCGFIHFDPAFSGTNPSYTIGPKYISMLLFAWLLYYPGRLYQLY